jgi:hypothetical protein
MCVTDKFNDYSLFSKYQPTVWGEVFSHHFPVTTWSGIAHSVQKLATGWTVRGSNPGGSEIFFLQSRQALGPTHLPVPVLVPTVKRPGRAIGHTTSSSTEVKERVEPYLYSSPGSSWSFVVRNLPFSLFPIRVHFTRRILSTHQLPYVNLVFCLWGH